MKIERIHLRDACPFLGEAGKDPVLTAYLPDNLEEIGRKDMMRPSVLVIPGGGYGRVSSREAEPVALHFLPHGYNVFILTYSVAPHRFPTQILEVAAAMELIYQNAEVWHVDTAKIAIMGFSAGGHLACHYSNCYQISQVRDVFPESKPVQAAILCYPVITSDPQYWHRGSFVNLSGHGDLTEEDYERFSLEKQVSRNTPPTFLWTTRTDKLVPVANTLLYAKSLADHDVPFAVHVYSAGAHGLATVDDVTNRELSDEARLGATWLEEVRNWLKFTL